MAGNTRAIARHAITAACLLVVPLIGWLDYVTGPDFGFSLFYLLPIVAAARWGGRWPAVAAALLASLSWFAADFLTHGQGWILLSLWNGLTRLGIFLGMGLLTASLRHERDRLEELTRQLETLAERESRLARVDSLTELPNSRAFLDALRQQLARCQRSGAPLALAYIDVDNFKLVNDTRGHAAGDELLRRLASALVECVREGDVAGRLGGDELAVLLPGATAAVAREIGDRYRARVAAIAADYPGCGLGVSIGIAAVGGTGLATMPDELLRQADAAMYDAKRAGRSKTVEASPHPPRL